MQTLYTVRLYLSLSILALTLIFTSCSSDDGEQVAGEIAEESTPHIVLIISDDQAWTDYSFMGHEQIATPHIDKLAEEGKTFTRGYVPTSLCSPSLVSIITGLYPSSHKVLGNDRAFERSEDRAKNKMRRADAYAPVIGEFEALNTLPDILKQQGYLSFQTGKWWLGNYANGGFDYGMTHGDPDRGGRHGDNGLTIGRDGMDTIYQYIDYAVEQQKPFFLWYAPFLPHSPHTPPDSLLQKYRSTTDSEFVAKYQAMCEWFDITCGQLSDYIDQKGLMENTLFVYVCDNGWVQSVDSRRYNKNSKRSPNDYGTRTPIIYKWKGKIIPAIDTTSLVSSIDILPTVLSLLDIKAPDDIKGINVLEEGRLNERDAIFGEIYAHDFSTIDSSLYYKIVYTDPYKLIVPDHKNKPNEESKLFNIFDDPFEQNNLAGEKPEVVEALDEALGDFWSGQTEM